MLPSKKGQPKPGVPSCPLQSPHLILPQSFLELSALEGSNADLAWALADFLPLFALPLALAIELDLQPFNSDAFKLPCMETMLIIMLFTYIFFSFYFLEAGLYTVAQTTLELMTIFGPLILPSASIIDMYHHA